MKDALNSADAPASYGHLEKALGDSDFSPSLKVTAHMDTYPEPDKKILQAELKRQRKEIKAINDKLGNWNHEEVSKQAQTSLKQELTRRKARLMELEAELGDEASEGEVGEDSKGSVTGGPYELVPQGGKFLVKNMETGQVKGTHATREKALRQFRLLEMKYHNEKKGKK